jgi:pyruvate formate lyase activating enzyme
MEALFYKKREDDLQCLLCPHHCVIPAGGTGVCMVRRNAGGILKAETWGNLSAINFDPIEKKPLYHFYPGKVILSLGSIGCNMSCQCCQNWQISQTSATDYHFTRSLEPEEIIRLASSRNENVGVAYTYNEPTVWFEYMLDIARPAHASGYKNVMVSNGYINKDPLIELMQYMDAFNIDLKGFTKDFYRKFTGARLVPVLQTLRLIRKAGKHLELTCLVIPGMNDDPGGFRDMTRWIDAELGPETILHLSRYHPTYRMDTAPTPPAKLEELYGIARTKLSYVYVGNILMKDLSDTRCSKCGATVIVRNGYQIKRQSLTHKGTCSHCGNQVIIC